MRGPDSVGPGQCGLTSTTRALRRRSNRVEPPGLIEECACSDGAPRSRMPSARWSFPAPLVRVGRFRGRDLAAVSHAETRCRSCPAVVGGGVVAERHCRLSAVDLMTHVEDLSPPSLPRLSPRLRSLAPARRAELPGRHCVVLLTDNARKCRAAPSTSPGVLPPAERDLPARYHARFGCIDVRGVPVAPEASDDVPVGGRGGVR